MIASVAFRNFKALRATHLRLAPFNLIIGPNGSGKTSLIQALLRLRKLARLPDPTVEETSRERLPGGPEIVFRFNPPNEEVEAVLGCVSDQKCDLLQGRAITHGKVDAANWNHLKNELTRVRGYLLDHYAIARPSRETNGGELTGNGSNLSAILAHWSATEPAVFAGFKTDVLRIFAEYDDFDLAEVEDGWIFRLHLSDEKSWIEGDSLSQGTLYALAILALAHCPNPPGLVCIEELDRGIHPRLLREMRDALYRLSYPESQGLSRAPVQIVATTHSPYLLDLFRDHPEEVVIAEKHGRAASFTRLEDRADLKEILSEGSLGDMWFAGILGGVPQEHSPRE